MSERTDQPRQSLRSVWLSPTGRRDPIATGRPDPVRDGPGVVWIDCAELNDWNAAATEIEGMALGGLTRAALGHLFEGIEPGGETWLPNTWRDKAESDKLATGLGVRFLNASWMRATFSPYPANEPPVLIQCRVSFLVGGDWLITNRVRGVGVSLGTPYSDDPVSRTDLEREVSLRWDPKLANAGDIAMLMLRSLARSYRPALATIESRLQNAELSFVRRQADANSSDLDADGYRHELLAMKWVVQSMGREVGSLSRRASPMQSAWFHVTSTDVAEETQSLIEEALAGARRETEAIRVGLDLIAGQRTTELLDLQRTEQAQSGQFEQRINVLAAILIGPALVAAVFDAMPEIFPNCWALRLLLLVTLMIAAGVLGNQLLKRFSRDTRGENPS